VDSSNRSIERIGSEGSRAVCDHADLLLLRCDDSQDLIDQDHFLAWDELLGLR
jgi:tRNA U34 5-carboxymethylaminomethyl modifying GTPase MnmE/TrmE|tara:strand:- start:463 stop:621 length:159 start_codon:yes stop_codon:yes gene_type:complete